MKIFWRASIAGLCALCLLAFVPSAAATELVLNGGFGSAGANWTSSNAAFASTDTFHFYDSPSDLARNGTMAILGVTDTADAELAQSLNLAGYDSVTLSFWYELAAMDAGQGESGGYNYLRVYLGGLELGWNGLDDVYNPWDGVPGNSPTWTLWGHRTATVDRSNPYYAGLFTGPTELRFSLDNTGTSDEYFRAYLDDISVDATAVPEPASMLLLGTGLAAAGAASRRRRRTSGVRSGK